MQKYLEESCGFGYKSMAKIATYYPAPRSPIQRQYSIGKGPLVEVR